MRIYMQTAQREGSAPRFFHLLLQEDLLGGWLVLSESGYQGSGGRLKRNSYLTFDEAQEALFKIRDLQIKRGYRVMFTEGFGKPDG